MILIAPDKFKGTFTSAEIGRVMEKYVRQLYPHREILRIEMADGGEGTAEILGGLRGYNPEVADILNPSSKDCKAEYFISPDGTQVVFDSAAFLGRDSLGSTERYDAMTGVTNYLARFVKSMAKAGAKEFTIGVGGTMTVDGGAGFLQETGLDFIDRHGQKIPSPFSPSCLAEIDSIILPDNPLITIFNSDVSADGDLGSRSPIKIKALLDVSVPLLPRSPGELSSLSFARQKGVTDNEMGHLENGLRRLRDSLQATFPHRNLRDAGNIGAGGGIAMALSLCNAELIGGAQFILDAQLRHYGKLNEPFTHVFTGEGCLDEQSFRGKVTGTIIERYLPSGIPVTIICGRNDLPDDYPLPPNLQIKLLSTISE